MKILVLGLIGLSLAAAGPDRVRTANGEIEGSGAGTDGVRAFKGIPFAAPPVGELRFAAPAPVKNWTGVKEAKGFGPRCMQLPLFGDMNFRSNGMGEDCLYLNVWTPAKSARDKLPVLVYFFGGGFQAGDGSEPRYDGESMAARGVVALTVNYRLGIFGFFTHPELTKASPHHASGDWALLDQNAALRWVRENIAAFGGDPKRVTIAGESAGSIAVSAQMASPLSKDLIAGAIGESGSILGALPAVPLAQGEAAGEKFAAAVGVKDVAALRAMPADQLLAAAGKPAMPRFSPVVDGYFFPDSPGSIFAAGKQANVPLLAGWNSEEQGARSVLGHEAPTKENFVKAVERLYGAHAPAVLRAWTPADDSEVEETATALASARFIAYSTWKWIDIAAATGHKPVYRYYYSRPRPRMRPEMGDARPGLAGGVIRGSGRGAPPPPARGAVHSAEIEYAMGNLDTNKVYDWSPDDYQVSRTMEAYFANFIKTGNPNGAGLPEWSTVKPGHAAAYMHIDVETRPETEKHRDRYLVLDQLAAAAQPHLEATSPLGTKFYSLPDEKDVVAEAEKALAADPKNPDLLLKLAQAQISVWQDREAVATLTRALAIKPNDAALLTERGHRELPLREFARAEADLKRAVELDPKRMDAYYHLGLSEYFQGKFAPAAAAFRKAVEHAPNPDEVINSTNWVYAASRRAGEKAEADRAAAAIAPTMKNEAPHTEHYLNLVRLFQGAKDEAAILPPEPPPGNTDDEPELRFDTVAYGVGNWHLYNGDRAKALDYFRRVVKGHVWITWGFIGSEVELAKAGK